MLMLVGDSLCGCRQRVWKKSQKKKEKIPPSEGGEFIPRSDSTKIDCGVLIRTQGGPTVNRTAR